jgi:hypothetical protein
MRRGDLEELDGFRKSTLAHEHDRQVVGGASTDVGRPRIASDRLRKRDLRVRGLTMVTKPHRELVRRRGVGRSPK